MSAVEDAAREQGYYATVAHLASVSADAISAAVEDLLNQDVEGVVIVAPRIHAFREAGLDVPRDVSVVGFDDIPEAAHFWPPLTTVRQAFGELGRRCVAMLMDAIRKSEDPSSVPAETGPDAVEPQLVIRDSVARVCG